MKKLFLLMILLLFGIPVFSQPEKGKPNAGYYEFQISIVVLQPGYEVL